MTTSDQDPLHNHRRQRSLLTGLSLLTLVLAIAPRQERALFITDAVGLKGFAAAVPPIDYASLARFPSFGDLVNDVGPRGFFARTPGGPAGAVPGLPAPDNIVTPGAPFAPSDQPLGTGQGPALQDAVTPAFPDTPGGGFPFTPASLSPPASSPAAPLDTTPPPVTDTPVPVVTPTPTPVATPAPDTPVATPTPTTPVVAPAVPEPGTWALMIFGFFAVGGVLRRVSAARPRDSRAV